MEEETREEEEEEEGEEGEEENGEEEDNSIQLDCQVTRLMHKECAMVPCTLNHTYIHANYKNKNWCHNRSKHKHYGYIYIYIYSLCIYNLW